MATRDHDACSPMGLASPSFLIDEPNVTLVASLTSGRALCLVCVRLRTIAARAYVAEVEVSQRSAQIGLLIQCTQTDTSTCSRRQC